jgi:hypothetical protein
MTTAESGNQQRDKSITEHELEQCQRANATGRQPVVFDRGHALVIDHGWREVADKALAFVKRFV